MIAKNRIGHLSGNKSWVYIYFLYVNVFFFLPMVKHKCIAAVLNDSITLFVHKSTADFFFSKPETAAVFMSSSSPTLTTMQLERVLKDISKFSFSSFRISLVFYYAFANLKHQNKKKNKYHLSALLTNSIFNRARKMMTCCTEMYFCTSICKWLFLCLGRRGGI